MVASDPVAAVGIFLCRFRFLHNSFVLPYDRRKVPASETSALLNSVSTNGKFVWEIFICLN